MTTLMTKDGKVCPVCLTPITQDYASCPTCKEFLGTQNYYHPRKVIFLSSYKILDKGEKIQVLADYTIRHATDERVWSQYRSCSWVLNTRTGMTYALPVRNTTTKRTARLHNNSLTNVTYSNQHHQSAFYSNGGSNKSRQMLNELAILVAQKHNKDMGLVRSKTYWSLQEIFLVNRFPETLENDENVQEIVRHSYNPECQLLRRYWGKKTPQELSKIFKFPYAPSIIKRIAKDPEGIFKFSAFNSLKLDNIIKLYDSILPLGKEWCIGGYRSYIEFIKLFKDETTGVNRVISLISNAYTRLEGLRRYYFSDLRYLFNDSVRMLMKLTHVPSINMKHLLKEKSLRELHDKLIHITKNMGRIDVPFENEQEMSKEGQVGDLIFSIPTSTNELSVIGNTMNICVGSYGDDVLEGRTKIAYAHRDNKLVACIEYDKRLIQVKGFHNQLLQDEDQKKVLSWAKHNHIPVGKTNDITVSLKQELPFTPIHQAVEGIRDFTELSNASNWVPF
jgi:hypothetical protein